MQLRPLLGAARESTDAAEADKAERLGPVPLPSCCLPAARRVRLHWRRLSTLQRVLLVFGFVWLLLTTVWMSLSHCVLFPSLWRLLRPPRPESADPPLAWMDARERTLLERTIRRVVGARPGHTTRMLEYGSGWSTFHFSRLVDEYYAVEHDARFCEQLFDMAARAGVKEGEVEVWRVARAREDVLEAQRWDPSRAPAPDAHIHIFCVPPTPGVRRTEECSWLNAWICCFRRCPSTLTMFEEYVRAASWIGAWRTIGRVQGKESRRLLSGSAKLAQLGDWADPTRFPLSHPDRASASLSSAPGLRFDLVLVDGRARAQAGWFVWHLLAGSHARVVVHDWNRRKPYHELLQVYDVDEAQVESEQPGGGGLVVLKRREETGGILTRVPDWWIGEEQ